ncbi:MAG: DUF4190 domain-containing protein [Ignavibacteria bacterium]|nr:DUF4190 domain-containing protein [Ignavibacteria bacterium]MBK9228081.1 DUF4190 domain-containing protein [Ignavibacteria bacterium]
MKYYSLHSQDYGSGNFPPPPSSNPPPPPSGYNAPPPPPPPPQMPYNQGQTPGGMQGGASSNAIIALVLGILSYISCGIFVAIPAWIIGKKELGEIDAGRSPENGRTMAKIGMWLGIVNVILSVIAIFVMIVLFLFGVLSMDDYTSI